MKKILAMFAILMTTIQVGQADDRISMTPNGTVSTSYYVPFLKDTRKRWSGYCVLKNGEEFLVWTFERQDTIIAGKTYSVIEYQGRETLLFYERQEGKKVYRYDEDTQAEVLMVDYSLEVGDEVEVDGGVKMKVVKTESAYETIPMYGLRNSKMMRLQGVDDETLEDVWVEGVGSIYWGVLPRGKMTDVEQMYVANVSFSFSEGNASFTINTERYKSCLLHYRNLTQEEKEFVKTLDPFKPEKLDIHFVDDTLCVTGILYFKPYDYQIDCLLDGTNIALNIYMIDLYDYFESPHTYYVEAKFPGFKEGVHHVSYNGGELVEVVCGEVKAENIPFVQDGKRWKTTYYWGALNDHLGVKHRYHYDFLLEGDTIINDEACKKMYVDSSLDGSRKEYLLALYQKGQKVYFVPKDSQEGLLLYDFGAEVGDIIEVFTGPSINPAQSSYQYSPVEMRVLDVEMRMYHGVERRCLYVINESDYQSYVDDDEPFTLEDLMPESGWWIEGLGKEGYPFDNTQVGMMMGGGMSTWLCTVGTDTLYTNGTFDPTANQCLVDGGMSWIQEDSPGNSVSPEYRKLEKRHFYFKWDEERVMIAGHRCRYLHASVLGEEKDEHIVAALYEEDGKVWFYPWKGSEDAYLLYDFHANEGDVLTVGVLDYWDDFQEERDVQQRKCKVEKVTEEEFKGIKRRCLYLNEAYDEEGEFSVDRSGESFCWIKGIGSLLGIEGNLPGAGMVGTPHQKLLECSWMDDVYYHDDETIFPDAIQDVHIDKRSQHAKEVYFDLTGRHVTTPTKGMYIRNGKKVLVR